MTEPRPNELPFEARLAAARARAEGSPSPKQVAANAFAQGTRLAIELVVAVLVGAAIGYGLDVFFGTSPFLLLVMFMFGLVAGFLNLVRAVSYEQAKITQAELDALPVVEDDDDDEKW
ncbi:MAG: AtpZ/AtpI family protein [Pacificimonas sp.]|nr:AtpZ/AtpI family protein [Pacificimonas sp.]